MGRSAPGRLALIAAPLIAAAALGAGGLAIRAHRPAAAPITLATPSIDPRLILYPRQVPVGGALAGGAMLTGSIYPGIPYRTNTIQLTVLRAGRALPATGSMTVSVAMAGMHMRPLTAALRPIGSRYRGALWLPMFGTYRGSVTLAMPGRRSLTGSIAITAPLPRS